MSFKITVDDWKAGKKKIQLEFKARDIANMIALAEYRGFPCLAPMLREWILNKLRIERGNFKKYGIVDNMIQCELFEDAKNQKRKRG